MEMEIGDERDYGVDETIFVAVGTSVEKSKKTLFWAVQSFAGKKICLLHVHQPANVVALMDRNPAVTELKEDVGKVVQELERKKVHDLLDQYHLMLAKKGVIDSSCSLAL
uniref:RING-type E3 ubiquitin transferase n=1 Tax=Rhizophora mucronata TaxID=61149 RepID=A0A2P2JH95_RHIMU